MISERDIFTGGMLLDISFTEVVVFRDLLGALIGHQKCNTGLCITVPQVHWGKTRHLAGPS